MNTRWTVAALALGVVALLGQNAHAELIPRSQGMVYDDVLKITWAPADLFISGYQSDVVDWADALTYAGFDDWRPASMSVSGGLPTGTATPVDCSEATEEACRDNEMGYMFYHNLGGSSGDDLTGTQGPVMNIQMFYWSGTNSESVPGCAWGFVFTLGGHYHVPGSYTEGAGWAVRDGDVATPAEKVTDVVGAFEDGVGDGTLAGSGPGDSADGRAGALYNKLLEAQAYIGAGDYPTALTLLYDIYKLCDGMLPPPDFIDGSARQEFADLVMELITLIVQAPTP